MGVQNLWDVVAAAGIRVTPDVLSGRIVAVDASIWLLQFLKAMRNSDGELINGGYLIGFFTRICKLLHYRILPVFVFDGTPPELKRKTLQARRLWREENESKIKKVAEKLLVNALRKNVLQQAKLLKKRYRNKIKSNDERTVINKQTDTKRKLHCSDYKEEEVAVLEYRDNLEQCNQRAVVDNKEDVCSTKQNEPINSNNIRENSSEVVNEQGQGITNIFDETENNNFAIIDTELRDSNHFNSALEEDENLVIGRKRQYYDSVPQQFRGFLAERRRLDEIEISEADLLKMPAATNLKKMEINAYLGYAQSAGASDGSLLNQKPVVLKKLFNDVEDFKQYRVKRRGPDNDNEEMFIELPLGSEIDVDVFKKLPLKLQYQILIQLRDAWLNDCRIKALQAKSDLDVFSNIQIEGYIRTVRTNAEINKIKLALANEHRNQLQQSMQETVSSSISSSVSSSVSSSFFSSSINNEKEDILDFVSGNFGYCSKKKKRKAFSYCSFMLNTGDKLKCSHLKPSELFTFKLQKKSSYDDGGDESNLNIYSSCSSPYSHYNKRNLRMNQLNDEANYDEEEKDLVFADDKEIFGDNFLCSTPTNLDHSNDFFSSTDIAASSALLSNTCLEAEDKETSILVRQMKERENEADVTEKEKINEQQEEDEFDDCIVDEESEEGFSESCHYETNNVNGKKNLCVKGTIEGKEDVVNEGKNEIGEKDNEEESKQNNMKISKLICFRKKPQPFSEASSCSSAFLDSYYKNLTFPSTSFSLCSDSSFCSASYFRTENSSFNSTVVETKMESKTCGTSSNFKDEGNVNGISKFEQIIEFVSDLEEEDFCLQSQVSIESSEKEQKSTELENKEECIVTNNKSVYSSYFNKKATFDDQENCAEKKGSYQGDNHEEKLIKSYDQEAEEEKDNLVIRNIKKEHNTVQVYEQHENILGHEFKTEQENLDAKQEAGEKAEINIVGETWSLVDVESYNNFRVAEENQQSPELCLCNSESTVAREVKDKENQLIENSIDEEREKETSTVLQNIHIEPENKTEPQLVQKSEKHNVDAFSLPNTEIINEKEKACENGDNFVFFENFDFSEDFDDCMLLLEEEQIYLKDNLRKHKRDADYVSSEMHYLIRKLLNAFGIPYVEAPAEAEAQCAHLVYLGLCHSVISDDSDCLLFGASEVYRNFFASKKYVEFYDIHLIERKLHLDQTNLILLAMLLGCDYTTGVKGIGIVNGIEAVNCFKTLEELKTLRSWAEDYTDIKTAGIKEDDSPNLKAFKIAHKNYRFQWKFPSDFPSVHVWNAFVNPKVNEVEGDFVWNEPNSEAIAALLSSNADVAYGKIIETLEPITKRLKVQSLNLVQPRIDKFFSYKPTLHNEQDVVGLVRSKRMKKALQGLAFQN